MGTATETRTLPAVGQYAGLVVGLAITAMSMSSGFIWASQGDIPRVYLAGFLSWTGYLVAHKAVTGVFIDDADGAAASENGSEDDGEQSDGESQTGVVRRALSQVRSLAPADPRKAVGFVAGIAVLVSGIAILAWYVRQGNHLRGNIGSGLFLGGYVIAHFFDSGKLL